MKNPFIYNCPFWSKDDHQSLDFPINSVPLKDGNVARGTVMITTEGKITNIPSDIAEDLANDKIDLLPHKNLYQLPDGTRELRLDQIVVIAKEM